MESFEFGRVRIICHSFRTNYTLTKVRRTDQKNNTKSEKQRRDMSEKSAIAKTTTREAMRPMMKMYIEVSRKR